MPQTCSPLKALFSRPHAAADGRKARTSSSEKGLLRRKGCKAGVKAVSLGEGGASPGSWEVTGFPTNPGVLGGSGGGGEGRGGDDDRAKQ